MSNTTSLTLGEMAARNPAAIRVFEKYGLDYCCGGGRPFEEACRERGLLAEQIAAEIARVATTAPGEERDWMLAPLGELIAHIVDRHHTYLREALPRLTQMAAKVVEAHRARHADTLVPLQEWFAALREELESHMWKEETVLFPLIRSMEEAAGRGSGLPAAHCGSVNNPIRVMEHEHAAAAHALEEMRRITGGYAPPEDACITYRAYFDELEQLERDLHQHIHLENNILFPRAAELEARLT
ncbi:MAG: iron-sulfur cluster repair di-iron protein [Bryobacterales bacterium]|nr:iron-sulfur cluster repair di-iron protein [Bryobacterales bacterium]